METRTRSIVVYYFIACLWSWPFFWVRDMHYETWQNWNVPAFIKAWSVMWGPGLAALCVFFFFRHTHVRRFTVLGSSWLHSVLFYLIPIGILTAFGLDAGNATPHTLPLILGVVGFVSTLGEELGWRGFLQDALKNTSPTKRYIIVGIMWEFWHFTNRITQGDWQNIALRLVISYALVIAASMVIGKAVERTRAVMVAVTWHFWINLSFEHQTKVLVPLILSSFVWAYLLKTWPREATTLYTEAKE